METFQTKEEIEAYITLNLTRLNEARANGDTPELQAAFERRMNEGLLEHSDYTKFELGRRSLVGANVELGQE